MHGQMTFNELRFVQVTSIKYPENQMKWQMTSIVPWNPEYVAMFQKWYGSWNRIMAFWRNFWRWTFSMRYRLPASVVVWMSTNKTIDCSSISKWRQTMFVNSFLRHWRILGNVTLPTSLSTMEVCIHADMLYRWRKSIKDGGGLFVGFYPLPPSNSILCCRCCRLPCRILRNRS